MKGEKREQVVAVLKKDRNQRVPWGRPKEPRSIEKKNGEGKREDGAEKRRKKEKGETDSKRRQKDFEKLKGGAPRNLCNLAKRPRGAQASTKGSGRREKKRGGRSTERK